VNSSLVIPAGSNIMTNFCIPFQVKGDPVRESNELLSIQVGVMNILDTIMGPSTISITIEDDGDGKRVSVL